MSTSDPAPSPDQAAAAPTKRGGPFRVFLQVLVGFVLPLGVLIVAIYFGNQIVNSRPTAERKPRPRVPRLVEVTQLQPTDTPVVVDAMGLVVPAREVRLTPQISGHVVWVSPKLVPGGAFQAGETLIKLDDADYRIVVQQRNAEIAQIKADIEIERGRQLVAKREYELLGESFEPDQESLVLREPQLAALQARLAQAQAQLAAAELDLSRTELTAPFNAQIHERNIELGTQVSTGTVIAELHGTDHYWVRAALPVDELRWLNMPRNLQSPETNSSQAKIFNDTAWGQDASRTGAIRQLQTTLETDGRMAQVLVAVDDPLSLSPENSNTPRLLQGSYVRLAFQGAQAQGVYELTRDLIRPEDTVWVMDQEDRLAIRPVSVLHRSRDNVLVDRGLEPGDRVVTTNLSAPVSGMPLRTSEDTDTASSNATPGSSS